jgi:hypothetical protein
MGNIVNHVSDEGLDSRIGKAFSHLNNKKIPPRNGIINKLNLSLEKIHKWIVSTGIMLVPINDCGIAYKCCNEIPLTPN